MSEQDQAVLEAIEEWAVRSREPLRKMAADLMSLGDALKTAQAAVLRARTLPARNDHDSPAKH